jgi:hypothetical protein
MKQNPVHKLLPALAGLLLLLPLAACQLTGRTQTRVAQFDWQFTPISDRPGDKDATFAKCDRAARDRFRFVTDYEDQISRYTLATIACMRIEGWGITKPPMQFVPRTPSSAASAVAE